MSDALQPLSRRSVIVLASAALVATHLAGPATGQGTVDDTSRVVDGVLAYLGVLPAAVVQGHPTSHPEGLMHGSPPEGRNQKHLVLALFDAASGDRIEAATVSVTVTGLGHVPRTRSDLEPMLIAGTVTWGTFVELSDSERYELIFDVVLPGRPGNLSFPFAYSTGGN